jgi:hypothetical protein
MILPGSSAASDHVTRQSHVTSSTYQKQACLPEPMLLRASQDSLCPGLLHHVDSATAKLADWQPAHYATCTSLCLTLAFCKLPDPTLALLVSCVQTGVSGPIEPNRDLPAVIC